MCVQLLYGPHDIAGDGLLTRICRYAVAHVVAEGIEVDGSFLQDSQIIGVLRRDTSVYLIEGQPVFHLVLVTGEEDLAVIFKTISSYLVFPLFSLSLFFGLRFSRRVTELRTLPGSCPPSST